jgi:hypothetical protein
MIGPPSSLHGLSLIHYNITFPTQIINYKLNSCEKKIVKIYYVIKYAY